MSASAPLLPARSPDEELARVRADAAERVRESEERFRHVADHSPAMFWVSEADGWCSYVNERWYEYTGQTPEDVARSGRLPAVHAEDAPRVRAELESAARERRAFRIEYRLRRHDGVFRWMADSAAPRFRNGQFAGHVGSLLDVTEKREELEQLERNRSHMQLALAAGRSGTFEWDMATGRVTWSPELERLYGIAAGTFEGTYRAWTQRLVPEDVEAMGRLLQRCFEERAESADFQFRARLPDGAERWIEGKARFIYGPNSAPRRMIGIHTDIDERKRAELHAQFLSALGQEIALLSDPERMIRATLAAVGEHLGCYRCQFINVDEATGTLIVMGDWIRNPAVAPILGAHPLAGFGAPELGRALVTKDVTVSDVAAHPWTRQRLDAYARLGIKAWTTAPFLREGRCVAIVVAAHDRPRPWRRDESQLLDGLVARIWPLVERARNAQEIAVAEKKIRESEERLRFTLEAAKLGAWDFDPRTGAFVFDARAGELFGFARGQAVDGASFLGAVHPDDRRVVSEAKERALRPDGGGVFDQEYRTVGPEEGACRWVRASGRVFFERGQAVRFMGTLQEITDLVQARETLAERRAELERLVGERTARLQETIGELESFSYSISHDLRAPLRAMQSFAQILNEECGEQLPAHGRDYLRRIVSASDRMDRLIHDVLVYSQVARTELNLGPVDVDDLLTGILETYPHLQPSVADVELVRPLPRLIANPAALTQCLSNILGNAVKFVAKGSRPTIRIWGEVSGARARLFIRDNGIGISAEHRDKIFGIFERLSRDYEGTGIGLAVVRKAAERMGGGISVESSPGQGSTFCLELGVAK